jgi:hypothetical protein
MTIERICSFCQNEINKTGVQIRAARALLRWTVEDLTLASAWRINTIRRAELAEDATSMTMPNDLSG